MVGDPNLLYETCFIFVKTFLLYKNISFQYKLTFIFFPLLKKVCSPKIRILRRRQIQDNLIYKFILYYSALWNGYFYFIFTIRSFVLGALFNFIRLIKLLDETEILLYSKEFKSNFLILFHNAMQSYILCLHLS